ncbi:hypothetical protein CYLTODRAFT_391263 [Cylindrobasidium torrendii FP15055 ss-10]|uniref:P-loop containing nucleoside triphosphate hydrolase protein n=1 Tax=Cylindrobasidium torrendii FP15055 ss-10 TaxID=1314674 RepID=A0A0D7BL02_9AGAR|nr:hypothetical protein CYLTODRAFT_391263 [Cylindrobasidium torrendii FP15055 ss-10]
MFPRGGSSPRGRGGTSHIPCRAFVNGETCKFGSRCRFSHGTSSSPPPAESPSSPSTPSPESSTPPRPNGVCNAYWTTGACRFSYNCKYRHEHFQDADADAGSSTSDGEEHDFFSPEGMAQNTGSLRSSYQDMKPTEVHSTLKTLARMPEFRSALGAESFARLFGSVSARNRFWNIEKAQELLDYVVQGVENNYAFYLIGEILHWPAIQHKVAGPERNKVLSFQRGLFPLLEFFSSPHILRSTIHQNINKLYTLIDANFDTLHNAVLDNLTALVQARSWKDVSAKLYLPPDRQDHLDGVVVFEVIYRVFYEFCRIFKHAVRNHPKLVDFARTVAELFEIWVTCIEDGTFSDTIVSSQINQGLVVDNMRKDIYRLRGMVFREAGSAEEQRVRPNTNDPHAGHRHEAFLSRLEVAYSPPGELHEGGPRHDNDSTDIANIRIAPTMGELLCTLGPYLPVFVPGSPHHLPAGSMEKHLDIQYRLLREELTSTIRLAISAISLDLADQNSREQRTTQLQTILKNFGGAYRSTGKDSVFFQVYTRAQFTPVKAEYRNFTVGLSLDAPPGAPRHEDVHQRVEYWQHTKRLSSGSLVALLIVSRDRFEVYLGTIASRNEDIAESAKTSEERIELRIAFFDPEVELFALNKRRITTDASHYAVLLDNNVMFESIRPFLQALKSSEPMSIPFGDYIAAEGRLDDVEVPPPRYACRPGFTFDLSSLLPTGSPRLLLDVKNQTSIQQAREELRRLSSLDDSQANTIVDALTRQICLTQGPPGTGKSYTGKELLRVLFANKIKPIVLIAYTNHALDHMLLGILDAGITSKIVRLGSRASDDRIAEYNLSKLEREVTDTATSSLNTSQRREYRRLKDLEGEMTRVMDDIQIPSMTWRVLQNYLSMLYPEIEVGFVNPPDWIEYLRQQMIADAEGEDGEWEEVSYARKSKQTNAEEGSPRSIYEFWKHAYDIWFVESVPPKDMDDPREALFTSLGYRSSYMPSLPPVGRALLTRELLNWLDPWGLNKEERKRLAARWEEEVRQQAYTNKVEEFKTLRRQYQESCDNLNDIRDQARQKLLSNVDLIGCTTTGAAKLISLLNTVGPKVVVVEEAGQVLESHVIAALVPSVEHLICIGDPEQLRPTLANYALSMDSATGERLFKFDRSLLERLASNGCAMSIINVQRRMRPQISQYPRLILYPDLVDHETVTHYPPVQGMQHNVFFFSHTHAEGGEKDSVSKYNDFEAGMIKDLVIYFLKQGPYSGKGDIAVLCAYLGQLVRVRKVFRDARLSVSVDERDQEALEREGQAEELADVKFENVEIAKHIRLGTLDTFQGDEAKIVIISLVRNSGDYATDASIGFLKSSNRINVAVSRAKHGMYIFGNAANLSRNATWSKILTKMEEEGIVGNALPIVCPRHPATVRQITGINQIPHNAPEGGCLERCEFQLSCGHTCPSVCHPDLEQHARIMCHEPCPRITCPRGHPCTRDCGDDCGSCVFPFRDVPLPCGHVISQVPCHQLDALDSVVCKVKVRKDLPQCEHSATMECHKDPLKAICTSVCGGQLSCCSRMCRSKCHLCQQMSKTPTSPAHIDRTQHDVHFCERELAVCGHRCGKRCEQGHTCNDACRQACRQACSHHKCEKTCSVPCAPCLEPCAWLCSHGNQCLVPCGSICSRLPCNEVCRHQLECGHECPSICGEPCQDQVCIECLPNDRKATVADFIMQRSLGDLDLTSDDVAERIITLACKHAFTVETLDGHCHMSDYYAIDLNTGEYTGMVPPPIGFQKPPSCPTCRGPITSMRYGRVMKRANLDILENNVASHMTKQLAAVSLSLDIAFASVGEMETAAGAIPSPEYPDIFDLQPYQARQDQGVRTANTKGVPLSVQMIIDKTMTGFSSAEAKAWKATLRTLPDAYKKFYAIATMRSPHSRSYEAALSKLYRAEFESMLEVTDEASTSATPEMDALQRVVNTKMGQPPHRADRRYQVEAFFRTIDIRFRIAQIARARLDGLSVSQDTAKSVWRGYIDFLYASCIADTQKAKGIAAASSSTRQVARCEGYAVRSEMFRFIFEILCEVAELKKQRPGLWDADKHNLIRRIQADTMRLSELLRTAEKGYVRSRPARDMNALKEELAWFKDEVRVPAETYKEEYLKLAEHIRSDTGYQPMSVNEMKEVVKAFGFSHTGHFYNCPNGHPFVITECGGAMQQAVCPECSAPIGGMNHSLDSSNTRNRELEDLARGEGAQNSPWAWGQGA